MGEPVPAAPRRRRGRRPRLGLGDNALLIKRVVAVGGDQVACCTADGHLLLNGAPLAEPYVKDVRDNAYGDAGSGGWHRGSSVAVPADDVWLANDNRGLTLDSRSEGLVPAGRVRYLVHLR